MLTRMLPPTGSKIPRLIPKLCLPLAIFSTLLVTGPNFDPLSDPLKPTTTRVHLVGPIPASQAYMLTGPVASHKVKDSEAASPNFLTKILHLWVLAPLPRAPFWPFITKSNGGTPSRPLTGLLCLHTHGVRCLPQGRKFRGRIPKLCLPQVILSPLFGYLAKLWAFFCPLITQSNGATPSRPHTGLPGLHADRAYCLPQGRRFRGRIPKLCLPLATFSPLLATGPKFDPLSHP